MKRLRLLLYCLLTAGAVWPVAAQDAPRPPNVLLIITDDQGYGDVGLHDNERISTPNLDRLGAESVRLNHFYVSPVCAPTRASLMTGRWNYRTAVTDTYMGRALMRPGELTLAESLRAAGYRTGIAGKWHLGDNYPLRPMDQGFEESLVLNGGGLAQAGDHPDSSADVNVRYWNPLLSHNGRPERANGYCTDVFVDATVRFIEQHRRAPWFAYLATNAPHTPLQVDEKLVEPYRRKGLNEETARVYAMVENIDTGIGRILKRLDELALDRETIVVFLTDNGPQQDRYNGGMRGRKGTPYEGGIRVPCFIRWRGTLQPGLRSNWPAAHIDLLPTLLAACGVRRGEGPPLDGIDILPYLRSAAAAEPERNLFLQWHRGDEPVAFRQSAVRGRRYKLVNGEELYDLVADPAERENLAARHPDEVRRLRAAYEDWLRDVSSAGYAPPRIVAGTSHEDPVILSRQDWRGPRAGWGPDSIGYWEIEIPRAVQLEPEVRLPAAEGARELVVRCGEVQVKAALAAGADRLRLAPLALPSGPARLEAWVGPPGAVPEDRRGVHYVILRKKG